MQEIVTASPAGGNYSFSTSQEILSPLANQAKTTITLDWSQTREHPVRGQERRQNQDSLAPASHQNSSRMSRKPSPYMNQHQRASPSDNSELASDRTVVGSNTNNRWRFNNAGQLIDSDISPAEWDLADEIMRLKIGTDAGRSNEDGQMRTPPQSKMNNAGMGQYHEPSPLDTSSSASVDSSSPHSSDQHLNLASHSRGSSTDTSVSSQTSVLSVAGQTLHVPALAPPKVNETRERPHSYSGGLSAADLRRLQQAGASPVHPGSPGEQSGQQQQQRQASNGKNNQGETPMYPTVAAYPTLLRPQQQSSTPSGQDYNSPSRQEEPEYSMPRYAQQSNVVTSGPSRQQQQQQQQFQGRGPNGGLPNVPSQLSNYVQPQRGFAPQTQGLLPSPTNFAYPAPQPSHIPPMNLGNAQQMYEMMLHGTEPHPAVARVQQQHGVARQAHQHSASDPGASLRDPAALALLSSSMQAFAGAGAAAPGMYPAMAAANPALSAMYANQFFPRQDMYAPTAPDLATVQALAAAQLQAQYTGAYPGVLPQGLPVGAAAVNLTGGSTGVGSDSGTTTASNTNGPSANNRKLGLYKTELCRSWEEKGTCRYGTKCQFAHGEEEIRKVPRHPKYKTEICRTFWVSGSCPYGKRCCFIHTELPGGPNADVPPPPANTSGRDRSNSDPNDASMSILARISAKRSQEDAISSPMQMTGRPPLGSLKLDTSSLGANVAKENKSAYPTFPTNGNFMHPNPQANAMSPGPVTAGPDFGRQNGRSEVLGQPQPRMPKNTQINPNVRHSFNGTEVDLDFNAPATAHPSAFGMTSSTLAAPRVNGHMRSGSAGNWSSLSRSHLAAPAQYPGSPNVEMKAGGHWATSEVPIGGSRLSEQSWI
ncbi:hypothetical protein GLOTRDRAFT_119002 [Gloeophyllum trabeum ATCC 11539]|uniref:C3H1-type domain-containing protein n=1 Tax=Gloeophyllum trabeum (strain ATCC 11539 / FP-39264 / Madison 617) TaxID=670483 RepID=S7QNV9_GLOTA|nr:uncharacterized protein GLOTRDRAFT_119002 [Gloeophyllum trabeum ATCC 11539]EPQ60982.1 hypothetical protein GLOTRDRAFT_119002 [Gloeophyllum trabeum ATCC 11539]